MCENAINRMIDPTYGRSQGSTASPLVIQSTPRQNNASAPVLNDVTTESLDARAMGGNRGRKSLRIDLDDQTGTNNGLTIQT